MSRSHHLPEFYSCRSTRPGGLSEFAWKMMQSEERKATLSNLKLISILAATMVPVFSILDYFAYPEHLAQFVTLRVMCTICIIGLLGVIKSKYGKRLFRALTVALPLIPAFFISQMILHSSDPGTPYYAGLTLCITAIGFLFHWTYREAFVVSSSILVMYLVACSPAIVHGMDSKMAAGLVNNTIFLLATGITVVFGSHAHYGFKVTEFGVRQRLRQEKIKLRNQKEELVIALEELSEAEAELIQSEKMASLGQLSAGMIHEIGNPLNYSNQALFLLRKTLSEREECEQVKEAIDDIQDSIDRMKDIVKELREFSHKSSEDKIEFSVKESIDVALRMLGKELKDAGVIVTTEVEPDLEVRGVKNQLVQVLINLVHNAVQALDGLEMKQIKIRAVESERQVEISIWDNGSGISGDKMKNIFDPFFTTKEVGEGTGLGLSICYRIVEAHHGSLTVDSEEGKYTKFTIVLPSLNKGSTQRISPRPTPTQQSHEHAVS